MEATEPDYERRKNEIVNEMLDQYVSVEFEVVQYIKSLIVTGEKLEAAKYSAHKAFGIEFSTASNHWHNYHRRKKADE